MHTMLVLPHFALVLMVYLAVKQISFKDHLAAKWENSYSVVMGWVKARLSFAILWATMLCVRGSQASWRSLGVVDGASISEAL